MNKQPKQLIKDIHLENMGFTRYSDTVPAQYYKEYGGLRLDAVMSDEYNMFREKEGWNILIFHDIDPTKITIIEDLNLFIELNNLLNRIHETYEANRG